MSGRLSHDLECDRTTLSWRRHVKHDDAGARDEFKRKHKSKRRKETMENVASMTRIHRCVALCNANGL